MESILFIKDKWNTLLQISLIIVLLVSTFTIPPNFDNDLLESQVDFISFSKFLVAVLLLIILVPAQYFKKKKHVLYWWITTISFVIVGLFFYFEYAGKVDHYTVYDTDAKNRIVIGDNLLPGTKMNLLIYTRSHPTTILTPVEWIQGIGGPEKVWPRDEIINHTKDIVVTYLITIICLSASVICGTQAVYIGCQKVQPN